MALIQQIIPVTPGPDPKAMRVQLAGITLRLYFRWSDRLQGWYMDVENTDESFAARGIRVVPYKGLLTQFDGYEGAQVGLLQVCDREETGDPITRDEFGERWLLTHNYDDGT